MPAGGAPLPWTPARRSSWRTPAAAHGRPRLGPCSTQNSGPTGSWRRYPRSKARALRASPSHPCRPPGAYRPYPGGSAPPPGRGRGRSRPAPAPHRLAAQRAPQHDDHCTESVTVGAGAGGPHHRDNLLDGAADRPDNAGPHCEACGQHERPRWPPVSDGAQTVQQLINMGSSYRRWIWIPSSSARPRRHSRTGGPSAGSRDRVAFRPARHERFLARAIPLAPAAAGFGSVETITPMGVGDTRSPVWKPSLG